MTSPFCRGPTQPQAALTDAGRATHGRLDQDLRDDQQLSRVGCLFPRRGGPGEGCDRHRLVAEQILGSELH
jgi:hypothetical protein